MSAGFPRIFLARHGETAWSVTGRHTGMTDLPLTEFGESNARRLGERLKGHRFAAVFASPLQRAWRTCELAGFAGQARVDAELVEWNYGAYEGMTPEEIRRQRPDWEIFRDGCPQGESLAHLAARAERVLGRVYRTDGDVLLFSSGHFLRVLATRWLRLDATQARRLFLDTATLSILGYHLDPQDPVIYLWNERVCGP
jgi:broad specificity phosphatase PhoE